MSAILFAPHNDDETLFAFYQCLRFKPHVVVVLRSYKQAAFEDGPTYDIREAETRCAMELAGVPLYEQWEYSDLAPDWRPIDERIEGLLASVNPQTVIAPAWEVGGHEHHNAVANIVYRHRPGRGIHYLTYRRGEGRSTAGKEVIPSDKELRLKQLALACYESQATLPSTAPWFDSNAYGDPREWLA
jgi:LmbE family N-acetylglucosaminyl deacetylase